jgi:hypothetical protein
MLTCLVDFATDMLSYGGALVEGNTALVRRSRRLALAMRRIGQKITSVGSCYEAEACDTGMYQPIRTIHRKISGGKINISKGHCHISFRRNPDHVAVL